MKKGWSTLKVEECIFNPSDSNRGLNMSIGEEHPANIIECNKLRRIGIRKNLGL